MLFADRYRIDGLLGEGGMGQVFRAKQLALNRDVALKIIKAAFVGEREVRFSREAQLLSRLDHRGCVRIVDYGRSGKYLFIAMELVEGKSLRQAIDEGPLEPARVAHIGREILSALAHAHAHGILHRDIKPENVMLGPEGRVVVIDFGLARALDHAPLTANGMCYGSPSYLAPERLLGGDYDERADVYAVGVLMYEALAGVRPFLGANAWEILRSTTEPPKPLRAPPWLDKAIARAMARDPQDRFADAIEMRSALDDDPAETMHAIEIARPTIWQRVWSRLRYGAWRWSGGSAKSVCEISSDCSSG